MCVPCVNVCEHVFQAVLPTPEAGISHVVLYSLDSLQDKVQLLIFQSANPSLAQTFHSPHRPTPLGSLGLRQHFAGTLRASLLHIPRPLQDQATNNNLFFSCVLSEASPPSSLPVSSLKTVVPTV